ncbi:hypothetical protein Pmi06nite_49190 [Planotetraspora mira]|uniref:Transmembrane protein n=1 Tax=Planotetraspora mira TaxID=58121 RepID=A0A8J3X7Y2_9ACTN|nr:hypothetical protein Pmi06nite_49190 [Planotetraspora mira]
MPIMADVSTDSTVAGAESSRPEVRVSRAMLTAIMAWVAAFVAGAMVSGQVMHGCDFDLYRKSWATACGPMGMWLTIGSFGWLATPLVWLVVGLFVGLAPRRLIRVRRTAVQVMPGLPMAIIALWALVFVFYWLGVR